MNLLDLSERLGRVFMTLLGRSWRILYVKPSPTEARLGSARGRNVLFSFWHGRQLPLIFTHRHEGVSVLVSSNRDGQYATNILHGMGFPTVRGSTSRGGLEALRAMSRILRDGRDCAITPDGPRGPAGIPKPGLAQIARLGSSPVVPMGTSGWPSVRMGSWDRFMLVLPFSRMTVVEGYPLFPEDAPDPDTLISMVRAETDRVTALADLLAAPLARVQALVSRIAGRILSLPARLWLMTCPAPERFERTGRVPPSVLRPIWMHGSSLGELRGLLPLAERLEAAGYPVHVSCFTRSGRKFLEDKGIQGSFVPMDNPGWVLRFLERIDPRLLVLSETELWPNLLHSVVTRGIPAVMVNARLSGKSTASYRAFSSLAGGVLSCFAAVLCRTDEDRERFLSLGVRDELLLDSGDSKALAPSEPPDPQWRETVLQGGTKVLVAGSTRPGEEEIILQSCRSEGWLPVLAPRHLNRTGEVMELARRAGMKPVRWSELHSVGGEQRFGSVVLDVHGILSRLYGIGRAAFVGGTLVPLGGHNVLEPLQQGVPVIVGQHHESFRREVSHARELGVGHVVLDSVGFSRVLRDLASDDEEREIAARRAGGYAAGRFLDDFIRVLSTVGIHISREQERG